MTDRQFLADRTVPRRDARHGVSHVAHFKPYRQAFTPSNEIADIEQKQNAKKVLVGRDDFPLNLPTEKVNLGLKE